MMLIVLQVVVDGALWGFGGNLSLLVLRRQMEGAKLREAWEHARREIWPVFKSDCVVWTCYNTLCYGVIPRRMQPISTAMMCAAWTAYISAVATGGLPN
mmetsp:Transcript_46699/g.73118  ORF Transcript_46699/g.73118 Transcript_46699/m.73118 type:complete len:99 (+) Transcript_46699:286-582(+)